MQVRSRPRGRDTPSQHRPRSAVRSTSSRALYETSVSLLVSTCLRVSWHYSTFPAESYRYENASFIILLNQKSVQLREFPMSPLEDIYFVVTPSKRPG